MKAKIEKDAVRNKVVTTRLTKDELKVLKNLCKIQKITISRLIRYSLEKTMNNN